MRIAFFGSSLVSAYWNGAATYYRGLLKALATRGHEIAFYEPDAFERQAHRDMPDPDWARVVVYAPTADGMERALDEATSADVVVKASGVGVLDAELEAAVVALRVPHRAAIFWDVDAPATLESIAADPNDRLRSLIPRFDRVLTYGGGEPVCRAYRALGARACTPIYNAVDPETHHPVPPSVSFAADLAFVGNRLPDREARVDAFLFEAARRRPEDRILLGGNGWPGAEVPPNVRAIGHVFTRDHNVINCSARCVLNISRELMARFGFSPATRVFEAAGAGACLISDAWEGIETFLEPGREILVAAHGADVAAHLGRTTMQAAAEIGRAARARVLAHHTYAQRAALVEALLYGQAEISAAE